MKPKYYLITILILATVLFSCKEDKWLEEKVLDFYSPEDSYITADQFEAAVTRLYGLKRDQIYTSGDDGVHYYFYTTDISYHTRSATEPVNNFGDALIPEYFMATRFWTDYYRIIFDANVILYRIENEKVEIESENLRNRIKAEARFFRALMYRNLGIQYGGVPLVLEEINGPKRGFVRATKEQTIAQAINDAEYAVANLPHVTEIIQDGRLTKAAANQLLAELYIIAGEYDKSIAAATSVIDDPNYALMGDRFGVHKDWEGDVYWDLFRRGNQNRMGAGNNTEAIWVSQYEYLREGGGDDDQFPRWLTPGIWRLGGNDGKSLFFDHSSQHGGRGLGRYAPSDFFLYELWDDPNNDIRNSEYNIIRDIVANNPESAYFGQKIVESGAIAPSTNEYNRNWTAIIAKAAPINDFPPETIADPETGRTNTFAHSSFRDHYYMRLAETYLLRAEAYLSKGEKASAANDINVVRARAQASPVDPGDVDIDYILDERARELNFEELRMLTLMRVGKWRERELIHSPFYNGKYASNDFFEHQQLFPIPQSEIERNTEGDMEQNPGYN